MKLKNFRFLDTQPHCESYTVLKSEELNGKAAIAFGFAQRNTTLNLSISLKKNLIEECEKLHMLLQ